MKCVLYTSLCVLLVGCSDKNDDTGDSSLDADAGGSGCEVVEETPLALDGTSPTGIAVTNMVNILTGEHEAELTWADGTTTTITATITDVENARYQDYEVVTDGTGPAIEIACTDQLVVDLQLSIVTADGLLNESMAHTATHTESDTSPVVFVDLSETSGTFDAAAFSDDTYDNTWANMSASWNENGIQGDISGFGEVMTGDIAMVSLFDIASFSAVGF